MKNEQRGIVVFDSGLGGISVLKKLVARMPNETFLYYGDSANAPYGSRPISQVCDLTVACVGRLAEFQPKAIVIACNTATAAALNTLERLYPQIPVIGIEPSVRQAARDNPDGNILVLATAGTLASARYHRQLDEVGRQAQVVSVAAPEIVSYVENGMQDRAGIAAYLGHLLSPWKDVTFDSVVLGCTHFPFAADIIRQTLGYSVTFYEPSRMIADETWRRLAELGMANTETEYGSLTIMNSANQKEMLNFAWQLFAGSCI